MFAFAKMDPDMTFRQFLDMRRDSNAYQALEQLNGFGVFRMRLAPSALVRRCSGAICVGTKPWATQLNWLLARATEATGKVLRAAARSV